jgi:hypothetical protein
MRIARTHGERLQLAARRQNLGAHFEFGRPRIDDLPEAFNDGFLLGSGARVLDGLLIQQRAR